MSDTFAYRSLRKKPVSTLRLSLSLKKDDNSIFIAHLSTERSLYGQHQLKKSKKLFKSLIANRLVKNVTDHQKDASVGL